MTFLNPWMLLGGLAAAVPIALHFFYRARYRPQPWAAMKFLRMALEQTSRRLRFQEVILLILRILICIILALALARPAMKALSGGGGRGDSVDAVIIIDTSYSMGAMEGDGDNRRSRLDRAKEAAMKVIDHLPPRSTVQVITVSDKAQHVGPGSPSDKAAARNLIQDLTPSSQSTDFQEGLSTALDAFRNTTGSNREIYLISDMQRAGWQRQSAAIRSKCDEIKEQATLYLVRVSDEKARVKNAAIVGIVPQDEVPHAGARIGFTVLVHNSGADAITDMSLTLQVDNDLLEKNPRPIARIGPGETQPVTITGVIKEKGFKLLTARIESDDLLEDNVYSRIIYVHEKVRVLVIDGTPNRDEPEFAGTFFLGNALLPVAEEKRQRYHVGLTILPPERAGPGELRDSDVCILSDVAISAMPPEFTRALGDFVRGGKGLIITAGPNVVAKDYNEALGDILPSALLESAPVEAPKEEWFWPDLDTADPHSFLAFFKGGGVEILRELRKWFTRRVLPVADPNDTPDVPGLGRVLLRFQNNLPMLLGKQVGNGEVLLLTRSVDQKWGIMENVAAFPPFINGCLAHLIERSTSSYNRIAGIPLRWIPPDAKRKYYLIKPDTSRIYLGEPKVEGNEVPMLTANDVRRAGLYKINGEDQEDNAAVLFALNPDVRESDNLESLAPAQIDAQLGFKPIHLTTGFDGSEFTGTERSRNEWTIAVLVALLIFGFGELIWAWVCGRAW